MVTIVELGDEQTTKKRPAMYSLASFNMMLAVFSMAMAVVALGLLAFVILRERGSSDRESSGRAKVKRSDSFVPDWKKPENLNPDFLQFHTLMFPKKTELKKPHKGNNQIMTIERRDQVIDMSGFESMVAPEKPLPPLPNEQEAIYENTVYIDERVRRFTPSDSSDSLRSSPFTSSTSLATSQDLPNIRDFASSPDMSESDPIEPPAHKQIVRLECSSPEERC